MFKDEKAVKADEQSAREAKHLAYLYVFEKCLVDNVCQLENDNEDVFS